MPVSVGNIPDITQRVHDSVDPINVTIGDIANTCKSNKSQSDEQAGDALDEAKKQNGPVMELLSHLSQALTPITADMISLTDQVNAKLRPYEDKVQRAQEEQAQIGQSNTWYGNEIAGEEADIVAAQAAFDALDTESETYADDANFFASEIATSEFLIQVYNEELDILNGPYAADWEAQRAYHQAIVDDIISIFNQYMDPIKRKYTDVDNGVIRTTNLTTSASNDLLDAASNIAKNIAKTADKASIELLKHVAAQTTVQKRSNSRDNDVKPTIKPVTRPEARAEPFVAKDGVLTYTRVNNNDTWGDRINAEDDIAANKYPNERLIRINKSSSDSGAPANEFNIDYIDGLYQSTFARPLTDYERDFWLRVIEDSDIFAEVTNAVAPTIATDRNPLRRILSYATSREPAWNLLKESTTPTLFETQVEKDWENYVIYTYRIFFGRAPTRDELIEARDERLLLEQTAKDQIGESGTAGQRTEFVWSDWQRGVRNAQTEVNLQPLINSVFRNLFSRDTTTVEFEYWKNQIIEKKVYLPYEVAPGAITNSITEVEYNDPEYFENIVLTDYMQDAYVPIDLDDGDVNNDEDVVLTAQAEEDLTVYIGNLYQKYFSRGPDSGGLASWLEDVRLSEDPAGLRIRMINGSQGTDRDAYISYLYNKLFQRNPSPQGIAHWNKQIADPNANPPTRSKLQAALLAAAQNSGDKEKADEYIQSLSVESSVDAAFVSITKGGLDEIFLRLFARRTSEEEFIYWSGLTALGGNEYNSFGTRNDIEGRIISSARIKALIPDVDDPVYQFFSVADYRYYVSKYNELSLDVLKDGELIVVEGTKWLPVLEWENQWFEKTGELIDLETRYDVINFKKGERQRPVPTTSNDFPDGTGSGTYKEPPKAAIYLDKLKRYNRFTGRTLLQGRYTVGSIGNPTTDKIAGQLAHEVRFQDNTNDVWKPGLPDIEVAAKNATQATAGMGGFDKDKIAAKKKAQEILTVYKTGVENAEAALEYNKFDSGKIVSDLTSPVTESKAKSARSSLVSARRICKSVHDRLLDILVPNVPGLLRLIARQEKPLLPDPSPDICGGARITGYYS